jgi:hypothetical protein
VWKFRGIFGSACRTRSHTPPKSAKVKLRAERKAEEPRFGFTGALP